MEKTKLTKSSHFSVRKMVMAGMFSAISIFLGVTGLGFINIPPVSATIMHVPVIIGAIIEGPLVGAIIGMVFGVFSIYHAITAPTLTSFIFLNPVISVLPRILVGIISYYVYRIISKKHEKIAIASSAVIGTFSNTFFVLGLAYLFYATPLAAAFEINPETIGMFLLGIGFANGIPEIIVSILISIPVVIAIKKLKNR